MKKKIEWDAPKISSSARQPGTYGSLREKFAKCESERIEYEKMQMHKAQLLPIMSKLLEIRLLNGHELKVMRPLSFQTSEALSLVKGMDQYGYISQEWVSRHEINGREIEQSKFQDVVKTIPRGSVLVLKSLETPLQQFIFINKNTNEELEIAFNDAQKIMFATDLYEVSKQYLETQEKE
jgi:hypothetical protein